ncbi:S1C family serine protease [Culicoidibacter larvae]|uniref:PDZ domain-containing protein n=1 Tax=Culicoidibacter larvae TaxID=2579976 RepID=A0A5R8QHM2_9FIRM|nr:trypsin-like peptidase domain-containing protein [Culicoidibacter larvae]TLG77462.1 PDZ domain-containing protein [Culicoidibacter larvae]
MSEHLHNHDELDTNPETEEQTIEKNGTVSDVTTDVPVSDTVIDVTPSRVVVNNEVPVADTNNSGASNPGVVGEAHSATQAEPSIEELLAGKKSSSGNNGNGGGNVPPQPPHQAPKKSGNGKSFLFGLLGGLSGALVIVLCAALIFGTLGFMNAGSGTPTNGNGVSISGKVEIETDLTAAVEKVQSAVVQVVTYDAATSNTMFGGNSSSGELEESGSGSGVVYKSEGNDAYVVTNNHVVDGAKKVKVVFAGGAESEATVVGTDSVQDLAVLKIDNEHVTTVATFGDSEALKLGEPVAAIGSPLGSEYFGTVTQGIISGKERTLETDNAEITVLQTDAAINPGNSGGALINMAGQVIGINSAKISTEYAEGMAFSIPSNTVVDAISVLETGQTIERPYLGIQGIAIEDLSASQRQQLNIPDSVTSGIYIAEVNSGSAAASAGVQKGDIITSIDGKDVGTVTQLKTVLNTKKKGDKVTVEYFRNGNKQSTEVTLNQVQ